MTDASGEIGRRTTARLLLRRPAASDAEWLIALHTDPRNYPYAPDGPNTLLQAGELVATIDAAWARDGIGFWIVEHAGDPVGVCGLAAFTHETAPYFNLYYRFAPQARGRGFAAETCREALAVAPQVDPARPVIVRTRPDNLPARRLAETLGLARRADLDAEGFVLYMSRAD